MQKTFSLSRNLICLYFIKVAKWLNLVMPIIVLFYQSNGLSMRDIFTLQAVYSFTLMLLEIPTGYFADLVGRRTSILAGSVLGFGGYLIYTFSSGFWEFAVAETILGVGMSLVSGADSAMLYDSLMSARRTESYTRYEGRITSIGNFAEAAAGIIGGLLAISSLRTPYFFQAGVAFLAVPAAILLVEPPIKRPIRKPGFGDIFNIIKKVIHDDKRLTYNTLFSAVTGASTLTMAWFAQPYFIEIGLPVSAFGFSWAILNLSVGLTAITAWKIEMKLGPPRTVFLFTSVLTASYIALSFMNSVLGLGVLLLFYLARGLATVTLRNYINLITTSDIRATVLSVRNFIIRLIFVLLGPLFGWITDNYGLSYGLLSAGIIFGSLGGFTMILFIRYKTYQ